MMGAARRLQPRSPSASVHLVGAHWRCLAEFPARDPECRVSRGSRTAPPADLGPGRVTGRWRGTLQEFPMPDATALLISSAPALIETVKGVAEPVPGLTLEAF